MKIAMVSVQASPLAGAATSGQSVAVAGLARTLARMETGPQNPHKNKVVVYTRRDDPDLADKVRLARGVTVEHVPAGPPKEISVESQLDYIAEFGEWLRARWAKDRPDVVHAHYWLSGLAALAAARDLDIPIVMTFHALGRVKRRHRGKADQGPRVELETAVARSVDGVIASSSDETFELLRMGVRRKAMSVVPFGVDTAAFTPEGKILGRPPKRPRLLYLGRLAEGKGVDKIVKAMSRVPGAELLIAGGPPADELDLDPDVARLRAVAARFGVSDRVIFHGRVERKDVPALIRSADLVVSMPAYEPFGMVTLEAMACGVPVVVSPVGGHLDIVVDGVTGVFVPQDRPDLLARRLRALLAEPTTRSALGIAGTDRARSRYAWERVAVETLRAYQRALDARLPETEPEVEEDELEEAVE
ncbi:glycosyltransferase [Bailinhaonella thermotolerans]|uniref:Glycosyltransferase family 1 protein n=1 Tax=Bailinhaonella thermotolerans TaxID=1070861 RepID=A0A3A4AC87_9ACTN|nr:glycosyltransferase [Bailinhaonella thermotolerans]RJL24144.1 glycosyltransferase family 1 protein [Bailinhaonella thermotolerans]